MDDHELLLDALVSALDRKDDLEVISGFSSVAAFEAAVSELAVDVVITDVDLAGDSGREIADLVHGHSDASVLVVTGMGDDVGVSLALECGAAGFISKAAPLEELAAAVRAVAGGSAVFPAGLLRQALDDDLSGVGATLTEREISVLGLLAQGRSATDISEELFVSLHTSRNHIRSILQKLHARSQLEAVVIAVRAGVVKIS